MKCIRLLEDWILNRRCRSCGIPLVLRPGHVGLVCSTCRESLSAEFLSGQLCTLCGSPLPGGVDVCRHCTETAPAYTNHRSAFLYQGRVATLIVDFKGRGYKQLAAYFAESLAAIVPDCDLLVPVPFRPESVRRRPFDPVTLIVRELSTVQGLPQVPLLRRRPGKSQKSLNRAARLTNLKNALYIRPGMQASVSGARICLIDDVFTTGATVDECARVLRHSGASRVYARTVAMD